MASIPSHAIIGSALGAWCSRQPRAARAIALGAVCASAPDLDAIGYWLGVPYQSTFGHRGFTHSLVFAGLLATVIAWGWGRRSLGPAAARELWVYLALATASHGFLDSMTDGGGGVAFFAPFNSDRYFLPWRPIAVSPMSISGVFSERGVRIISTEAKWIWLPASLIVATGLAFRRARR